MWMSDGMPGPDGVPYAAWRAQFGRVAPVLHVALSGGSAGASTCAFNRITMAYLPKCIPAGAVEVFSAEVCASRRLTLTDTCPKIVALSVNDRLAALATITVISQQRGFVAGRLLKVAMIAKPHLMCALAVF